MEKVYNGRTPLPLAAAMFVFVLHTTLLMASGDSTATAQGAIDLVNGLEGAHAVQAADLDRDGDIDVIAVGRDSGRVVWLENLGGGSGAFVTHEIGLVAGAYSAYAADLNGNGATDIAVVGVGLLRPSSTEALANPDSQSGSAIVWFENNLHIGAGFIRHTVHTGLSYPVAIVAADLDHDGDLDLIVADRDANAIYWFENNGLYPPSFTAHLITANAVGAVSVFAADINGDGRLDVVAASERDNKIVWYANDGGHPPTFTEFVALHYPAPDPRMDLAKAVFAADLNQNGRLDIVYAAEDNGEVGWLENLGGSVPQFQHYVLTNELDHTKALFVADLNHSGRPDILVASSGDHRITQFENLGGSPPTFAMHVVSTAARGARAVHAVDLNGNGHLDILSASRDDHRIVWYSNRTSQRSTFFPPASQRVLLMNPGARSVIAVDIDNDGDRDILSVSDKEVIVHENLGGSPPGFAHHVIATDLSGGRWVHAADLTGDGRLDILAAAKRNDLIAWYENLGGSPPQFRPHVLTRDARGPRAVLAADLNRDGRMDIYSASDTDNAVYWYENLGGSPPQFVRHTVTTNAQYVRSVYAADLNGNGRLDLMSASQRDNKIAWYENLGGSPVQFVERVVDLDAHAAQSIRAADLNRNGRLDLVVGAELAHAIYWYENLGGEPPQFVRHTVTDQALHMHTLYTEDVNRDGWIDIVAAIEGTHTVAWYENRGGNPPTFVEHIVATNAQVAHGVFAADIDGDGDIDLISASRDDGKIAWYENLGGHYAMTAQPNSAPGVALEVTVNHRGRPGDPGLRMNLLELQFVNGEGLPLATGQVNQLIARLDVYRVECCGRAFDPALHPLVATVAPLALNEAGRQVVWLVDGDPYALAPVGAPVTYAVVVQPAAGSCASGLPAYSVQNVPTALVARNVETGRPLLAEGMRSLSLGVVPDLQQRPALIINEFMASNQTAFEDPDARGHFPDWIELYNRSSIPIHLGGKYLTDNLTRPDKFRIPDGLLIEPFGYTVFFASGEPNRGPMHTNFRLDREGEAIGLFESDATGIRAIDSVVFDEQEVDVAMGRYPNGSANWQRLAAPTPGGLNAGFVTVSSVQLPFVYREVGCP